MKCVSNMFHGCSTNPEKLEDTQDNNAEVEIPVTASADITIYGYAPARCASLASVSFQFCLLQGDVLAWLVLALSFVSCMEMC